MRTRPNATTLLRTPAANSGASDAQATMVLLLFIFVLALLTGTMIKDPLVSTVSEFGRFRAWGAENEISDIESTAPGISITLPEEDDIYYFDERVGITGRAVPDEGRSMSMVFYRVNGGDWLKATLADDTWTGTAREYPEGCHQIEAIAFDDNGGQSDPANVNFTSMLRYQPTATPAPEPTPEPTAQPTTPPYVAYDAYGKFIMIGTDGSQETGYIFLWCYDGPFGSHNQRSSYLSEPSWPHPDWDIGGPNGHYTVYSDHYDGSGSFEMNYGGTRGPFTFYVR